MGISNGPAKYLADPPTISRDAYPVEAGNSLSIPSQSEAGWPTAPPPLHGRGWPQDVWLPPTVHDSGDVS
jgi:hypothetical protein